MSPTEKVTLLILVLYILNTSLLNLISTVINAALICSSLKRGIPGALNIKHLVKDSKINTAVLEGLLVLGDVLFEGIIVLLKNGAVKKLVTRSTSWLWCK
jgi:hypothetical protein